MGRPAHAAPKYLCGVVYLRARSRFECRALSLIGPLGMIAWFGLCEAGALPRTVVGPRYRPSVTRF